MNIYTEVIFDMNATDDKGRVKELSSKSYNYEGDLALCVPYGDRHRWLNKGSETVDGVTYYTWEWVNYLGDNKKKLITLNKPFNKAPKDDWGNVPPEFNDTFLAGSHDIDKAFSFDEDYTQADDSFRESFMSKVAEGNPKALEYYNDYGKKGIVPDSVELKDIKNNAQGDDWKMFLRYGLGVKNSKIDNYLEGGAGEFEDLLTKTDEDIQEWARSEDINDWFVDERTAATEGEVTELKSEEEIIAGTDPRMDQLLEWKSSNQITGEQYDRFVEKLRGTPGAVDPNSIMGKEAKARQDYRDALTGQGGYEDTLAQLVSDKAEEMKTLGISKESSLDDILEGYMAQSDEYKDVYGQQVSDITTEEDIMRSKTGLSRDEEDISGLVEGYEDDYTKRIEDYRKQTGATQEEAIEGVRTAQTAYDEGVGEATQSLDFAFKDLEDAWGGGLTTGTTFLDELTTDYWGDLESDISEIDQDSISPWWGQF